MLWSTNLRVLLWRAVDPLGAQGGLPIGETDELGVWVWEIPDPSRPIEGRGLRARSDSTRHFQDPRRFTSVVGLGESSVKKT
jgi:hypothetical protein